MNSSITVKFNTDNAAFDDDKAAETLRVLKQVADRVGSGSTDGVIRDYNGNKIGEFYCNEGEN